MERIYAAMILALDRGIGSIIDALKETDQYDNTIIIFTSDNGGANYAHLPHLNHPYRGWKATLFEGGVHVPLFMQWPKMIKADKRSVDLDDHHSSNSSNNIIDAHHLDQYLSDQPVSHIDLFPTILSIVNCSDHNFTSTLDGIDLWPLISSTLSASSSSISSTSSPPLPSLSSASNNNIRAVEKKNPERILFWRSGEYKALRHGDFKLQISSNHRDKVWFYDLKHDPYEQMNLAEDIGIHTVKDLYEYAAEKNATISDGRYNDGDGVNSSYTVRSKENQTVIERSVMKRLLELNILLQSIDEQQKDPQWPVLYQVPVLIDKIEGSIINRDDEYICWDN